MVETFSSFGFTLTPEEAEKFSQLLLCFQEKNSVINLSAKMSDEQVIVRHFIDSLFFESFLDASMKRIIDIGTGGGFPLLPLSIRGWNVEGMDSVQKKLTAISDMAQHIGFSPTLHHRRFEDAGRKEYREQFDAVVSRAVAPPERIFEYALPLVKTGGRYIGSFGPSILSYLDSEDFHEQILQLGATFIDGEEYELDGRKGVIAVFEKIQSTPKQFPRLPVDITKKPIVYLL